MNKLFNMDAKLCPDLDEDEELASLRLAALATLKKRPIIAEEVDHVSVNNILPINSITRTTDYASDQGSHKNHHLWRNNMHSTRNRGRTFSKPSQRSNLIVITPVGVEKDSSIGENSSPLLQLPQHKWCHQANEDSSSPRTDRHTGPTRFNRHISESESSDSDFDESDDSYSNETVLQDEPSQFSQIEDSKSETELKNNPISDQRLSFQSLDSNFKNDSKDCDSSPVSDCENTKYCKNASKESNIIEPMSIDEQLENSTIDSGDSNKLEKDFEKELSAPPLNSSPIIENGQNDAIHSNQIIAESDKTSKSRSKHTPIRYDMHNKTNLEKSHISQKEKTNESLHELKNLRNNIVSEHSFSKNKTGTLPINDLRYELKRKKDSSRKPISPNQQMVKSNKELCRNKSRKHIRGRSWSRDRSESHERRNCRKSRSRTPKNKRSRYNRSSSSRSWSSTSSSITSMSSSSSSPAFNRSVSSVVQSVQSKRVVTDNLSNVKSTVARKPLSPKDMEPLCLKKAKCVAIKLKPVKNFKISVPGSELQNNASDIKKRGPVHMRLGTLPRKRIIQMPKAVEAAFVNTSSDDDTDVNIKCKKSNVINNKEKDFGFQRNSEKGLSQRSHVPKAEKGRVLR